MSDNLYFKKPPITVPENGKTVNIIEERVEPLYPVESKHNNTQLFFDTLILCYCTAIVIQIFTFLPIPHYYVTRAVNVCIGGGIFAYGLIWAITKEKPSKKVMFSGLAVIVGVAIGL